MSSPSLPDPQNQEPKQQQLQENQEPTEQFQENQEQKTQIDPSQSLHVSSQDIQNPQQSDQNNDTQQAVEPEKPPEIAEPAVESGAAATEPLSEGQVQIQHQQNEYYPQNYVRGDQQNLEFQGLNPAAAAAAVAALSQLTQFARNTGDVERAMVELQGLIAAGGLGGLMGVGVANPFIGQGPMHYAPQLGHSSSYHIIIQGEKKMGIEEIEKSCATSLAKEKIFVQAVNHDAGGFQFSEFYTLDLRNGQVSECPYALLADSGFNTMISLGSIIYVVGALRPEHIRCKTKPPHSQCTKKGLYHKCMSYLDLANDTGDGWKKAPCLSNGPSPDLVALAFGGKIYVFHTKSKSETAHVFDPVSNKWGSLLPPPGVPFFDTHYAAPAVADSQNNRILVHFLSIQSVFAYYPANNRWELVLKPFPWSSKLVFVDGVIFFYIPEAPEFVDAYHVATKQWLNIVFTSELPRRVWIKAYDAMFYLGSDLMCLAAYSSKYSPPRTTHVILTKFRFELSPHNPADLLITPLPDETYAIGKCSVNRVQQWQVSCRFISETGVKYSILALSTRWCFSSLSNLAYLLLVSSLFMSSQIAKLETQLRITYLF